MMMKTKTKRQIWVDLYQGEQRDGRAFGYVGLGTNQDRCGMFFAYPPNHPPTKKTMIGEFYCNEPFTREEVSAICDSLEYDETDSILPKMSRAAAERALRSELRKHNKNAN
jgi:hypothetical protein